MAYGARIGLQNFSASSAGTHALTGYPIEPSAARVLQELGGDTSRFAARQLKPTIAADADLVLTMTKAHREAVLDLVPQQLHKTFTLPEAAQLVSQCNARNVAELADFRPRLPADGQLEISDPIGRDEAFFAMIGAQIADLLPPILRLCRGD
jgi:protein-tyrosine phosphatase